MTNKNKWCYSEDGERFSADTHETKEELIAYLKEEGWETAHIGRVAELSRIEVLHTAVDLDQIFERVHDVLDEEVGEAAENFSYMPKWGVKRTAPESKLHADIVALVYKHMVDHDIEFGCYRVADTEEVDLKDIDDAAKKV